MKLFVASKFRSQQPARGHVVVEPRQLKFSRLGKPTQNHPRHANMKGVWSATFTVENHTAACCVFKVKTTSLSLTTVSTQTGALTPGEKAKVQVNITIRFHSHDYLVVFPQIRRSPFSS
jgi:hypothetical protein